MVSVLLYIVSGSHWAACWTFDFVILILVPMALVFLRIWRFCYDVVGHFRHCLFRPSFYVLSKFSVFFNFFIFLFVIWSKSDGRSEVRLFLKFGLMHYPPPFFVYCLYGLIPSSSVVSRLR